MKKVNGESTNQTISLVANTDYTISVWIDSSDMTGGISVFDTTDVFDGSGQGQFVVYGSNGGWTQYNGSFNSGSTTSITLRIFDASTVGTVYYDDIVVAPAS